MPHFSALGNVITVVSLRVLSNEHANSEHISSFIDLLSLKNKSRYFISFLLSIMTQLFFPFIELAKEGIPLPFGNKFWASNWPTGKSPLPGLIVHLIPSVSPKCAVIYRRTIFIYRHIDIGDYYHWTSTFSSIPIYIRC